MSSSNQKQVGNLQKHGCSPMVLLLAAVAVMAFSTATGVVLYGTLFTSPGDRARNEAGTRIVAFLEQYSSTSKNDEPAAGDGAAEAKLADSGAEHEEPSDGVTEYVEDQVDQDPVPVPDEVGDQASQLASAPDPKPEGTSTVPEASQYMNAGLGTGAEVYDHYSYGSLVDKPEPYTFVEAGMCGIRTEIYSMHTADRPGTTPSEVVDSAFHAEIAASSDKYTWTPLGEPFELEVNGQPAIRL